MKTHTSLISLMTLILALFLPAGAQGQTTISTNGLRPEAFIKTDLKPWSFAFGSSYSNKLYVTDDTEDIPVYSQSIAFNYNFRPILFSVGTTFTHLPTAQTEEPNSEFNDFSLGVSHPLEWTKAKATLTPHFGVQLPLSYQARNVRSQRFATRVGVSLSKNFKLRSKLSTGGSLSFSGSYLNHKFEESAEGDINPQFVYSPMLGGFLSYAETVGVFGSLGFVSTRDYRGYQRSMFSNTQGVYWNINSFNKVSLGHAYRANTLQPDGRTQDLRIASELYSQFFAKWELSI